MAVMADPKTKAELDRVLSKLHEEVGRLERTHADDAKTIAGFAELSAHEATRATPRPEVRELALRGLQRSVRDLENSHPQLVEVVGALSSILSNLGL
jgi:hypothetical protein